MDRHRGTNRARGPWRRALRRLVPWVAVVAIAPLGLAVAIVVALRWVPPPTTAFMLLHRLEVGRAGQPERAPRYRWVDWAQISPELAVAVVAAEDQRFRLHRGLDFEAIDDALEASRAGGPLRGASTISQQVAKNLFLWPARSLVRKGLEACLTVLIELTWSKRRILEVYLNVAEFGDGVYGVGIASERFFARPASGLDRGQAELLAAVLPNPKRLDAGNPSTYVRGRQQWILLQMDQLGGLGYLKGL